MVRRTRKHAFTLVELAFVLAFILVLFAMAIPNFLEAQTRAEVARSKLELVVIASALESYRTDLGAYPPNKVTRVQSAADLVPITTPIAYMTRLPRLAKDARNPRHEVFPEYLNLGQIYPPDKPYQPPFIGGCALYSITYTGPDGVYDTQAATDPITYNIYDPTNGTTSKGDTVVFGP